MVWQRFAKSPRIARAGSTPVASAKVSAVRSSDSTGGCQRSSRTAGNIRTCSSAESERDSAKVEVARSNRAGSTNLKSILRSGRTGEARVSETRLRRFESYLRSHFEKFDAEYTGVVKPPGTDS